eukprot:353069-Chlamydomonas_euryale.AAC.10
MPHLQAGPPPRSGNRRPRDEELVEMFCDAEEKLERVGSRTATSRAATATAAPHAAATPAALTAAPTTTLTASAAAPTPLPPSEPRTPDGPAAAFNAAGGGTSGSADGGDELEELLRLRRQLASLFLAMPEDLQWAVLSSPSRRSLLTGLQEDLGADQQQQLQDLVSKMQ